MISRRVMLTVSTAAGLSGLCAAYAVVTRPLLKPAEGVDHGPLQVSSEPIETPEHDFALRYLPDQPWAAKADFVIRNGRSLVFFNTYEPTKDGKAVEIAPFAMVFPPKGEGEAAEPLTIVGEAAILRVAGSIDLADADPGRIVGASVPGPVRLRGPEGFDLQGSNFVYDEAAQRLWSDEAVAFRHAEHSGRGRGVQLDLLRIGDPAAFESVACNGIRTLRLLSDVEMRLQLGDQQGGPFGAISPEAEVVTVAATATEPQAAPTHVTCKGSFTFELGRNVATFDEHVVASRPVPDGAADSLECDKLEVWFEPSTEEAKLAAAIRRQKIATGTLTEDDGFQAIDEQLAVKWLVATGENTVLRSPTNEFVATLSRLAYDAASGATTLSREGGAVVAQQGTSVLRSPVVSLLPAEKENPPSVVCTGQGSLRHFNEQGALELEARWNEQLHRMRAPSGYDLIRLTGLAEVEQPAQSFRLDADVIDLWLDPQKGEATARPTGTVLSQSGRMEPLRLIAEATTTPKSRGLVMLRSPELAADAKKLDVTFVEPKKPESARVEPRSTRVQDMKRHLPSRDRQEAQTDGPDPTASSREERRRTLPDGRGSNIPRQTVSCTRSALQPTSGRIVPASAERAQGPPPAPPPEPREEPPPSVTGTEPPSASAGAQEISPQPATPEEAEVINVVVERGDSGTATPSAAEGDSLASRGGQVREVHTTGGVVVIQKRRGSDDPLSIWGDKLDLFNRGKGEELIHIYGAPASVAADGSPVEADPARVHDGGADLYGMNVNLDRKENRAWVEGKGVLMLPAKGVSGRLGLAEEPAEEPAAEAPASDDSAEPERLNVWWTDRMEFSGDTATFYGDVRTQMQGDVMSCREMEVRLTQRFDFGADERDRSKSETRPEVAEVICKQGVRVDGQELKDGKLISVRHAEFYEFHFDQRTGDTHAFGPGHIKMWKVGDRNRASLTANNAVRANSGRQPAGETWEYLFVRFNGTSDGNINARTTTFHDRVRIVYGPVADWKHEIDPDRVDLGPAEGGWMKCGELTLTQHAKSDTAASYSEVLGRGNVQINGRGFSGVADQVSYDESKEQYILKALGGRFAIVSYEKADGSGMSSASAREIMGHPSRMDWHGTNVSEFNGAQ